MYVLQARFHVLEALRASCLKRHYSKHYTYIYIYITTLKWKITSWFYHVSAFFLNIISLRMPVDCFITPGHTVSFLLQRHQSPPVVSISPACPSPKEAVVVENVASVCSRIRPPLPPPVHSMTRTHLQRSTPSVLLPMVSLSYNKTVLYA